jgi:acetylornithine deacetylase/succinyl-diaminopimelate desuccinylase-like protein
MNAPTSLARPLAEHVHLDLVEHVRALLRLRTVNPPGDEILATDHLRGVLDGAGIPSETVEPFPRRASIVARVRGDGSRGGPLLLLGHLDVVPVEESRWSHDPFGAEIVDGRIYGRGAVDMKAMVAMELEVMLQLASIARAAGLDPAQDPVPGLGRDVIFAATADEETGGFEGAGWIVDHRPDLVRAEAALSEAGGVAIDVLGRRFYPVQVAEKGFFVHRVVVHGTPGHGSVPREDNAAVLAARVVDRLTRTGTARATPVMADAVRRLAAALPRERRRDVLALLAPDTARVEAALERLCVEPYRRTFRALLFDTLSPDMIHAGTKYNVIPGRAEIEIDCRLLPGTPPEAVTRMVRERIGDDLAPHCEILPGAFGPPVEQPTDSPLLGAIWAALARHDPDGVPIPMMAPFATDAKHLHRLGIPTYGFSPLRPEPGDGSLDLFHADDERVSLAALRFGFPVLWDVVLDFCGA